MEVVCTLNEQRGRLCADTEDLVFASASSTLRFPWPGVVRVQAVTIRHQGKPAPAISIKFRASVALRGRTGSNAGDAATTAASSSSVSKSGEYVFYGFRDTDSTILQLLKFTANEHKLREAANGAAARSRISRGGGDSSSCDVLEQTVTNNNSAKYAGDGCAAAEDDDDDDEHEKENENETVEDGQDEFSSPAGSVRASPRMAPGGGFLPAVPRASGNVGAVSATVLRSRIIAAAISLALLCGVCWFLFSDGHDAARCWGYSDVSECVAAQRLAENLKQRGALVGEGGFAGSELLDALLSGMESVALAELRSSIAWRLRLAWSLLLATGLTLVVVLARTPVPKSDVV